MAVQPPLEREDSLPPGARRQWLHPGGDVEGDRRRAGLHAGRPPLAGNLAVGDRHGAGRRARTGRVRDRRHQPRRPSRSARLPHHAEGTRRRLPARSAPSLDPHAAAAGDPAGAARSDQRGARFLQPARLHPLRHADFHAGGLRGHDQPVPGPVLRGHHRVPHAERAAVQRGQRDGARARVLLRPDVSRREVQDAPAPHRVLDGRTRDGVRQPRRRHRTGRATWSSTSWGARSTSGPPN